MGTAGVANVTNTFTADAAWTNPAGITGITEDSILGGLVVTVPKMEFKSTVSIYPQISNRPIRNVPTRRRSCIHRDDKPK